ncbi:bifunctional 4-hydroxy-3-methylbut-2-enyl diphosphate reductase/30S ribosomal protein S1 [Eubacterium sp. An11]|uniref:bifunctional 4-hydroxy-3-methylbut-2-enyl diphosphate reductase/30S ribosomal protein S1 n=1 Tax=Eubacterium sp. An11 TaxID=1965542 RepID=UPI000B391955|nr:bifunctional 4-hydroxy-3-methylbut-2-enyl diphosphate reductase/30S ribosomal protein S1 [Eubacterium sp. An11]OUQ69300.1 bifunctional 4-hydroxy-3-methylbut-2-enyl diphosphate reductase/30S ribosomal protein S1 [Eubacterium sp. An11]
MEINIAKSAGFCFGVRRAVDTVYKESGKKNVYTYGPIIHNDEVVADLERQGVGVIYDSREFRSLGEGTIIIRSHGVPKAIYDEIAEAGLDLVDATCPFVRKIHRIVERESREGRVVIIVGNNHHPEVEGIMGWCHIRPIVIENREQAEAIAVDADTKLSIVSQTTFNYNKFQYLVEIISEKGYDINVFNTICNATEERQKETRELAMRSDAMIVIGGRHSSNTQKLFEISKKECSNTFYIQTKNDLNMEDFHNIGILGITAGASTPNNIIKEVHESMAEMSFDQMLEESFKTIRNGEVVQGTIIDVKEDEIILNIGYKSDGIITRNEYSNDQNLDLTTVAKVGDEMEAKVLKVNDGEGQVLLTYKRLKAEKGNKRLEEAFNNKEVLKAKVAKVLDGGLSVVVEDTRVFIPASLVSDTYEKNLKKYDGQEIEFVITEFNPRKRRIIGDRKQLLVAEKKAKQEALFARIEPGMTVEGTVKNVTDFGAFIDLGGADGLLHISEMSWGRVENPKKVFTVGEQVKVLIKDIQGEKIALSLKFPETNPWLTADEKYAVGNVVTGKVARMTDFGAFIELEPGVDALLHVSQIAKEHIEKPSDVLKVGEEITAKVVDFKKDERKISLSIKALDTPKED